MNYKILLVDDEEIYLQYMKVMIDWGKYNCTICGCAKNGLEALQMVENMEPDIIFMDINMDQMDGLEACARLRQKKENALIVIMTGYDEFSFAQKAIKLKVNDYLLKPFDETELLHSLTQCLSQIEEERLIENEQIESKFLRLIDLGEIDELKDLKKEGYYTVGLFQKQENVKGASRKRISQIMDDYFSRLGIKSRFLGNYQGCGIAVHSWTGAENILSEIKERYQKLLLERDEIKSNWVAIGSVANSPDELQKVYQDALLVKQNRIKLCTTINSYDDLKKLNRNVDMFSFEDITELISELELKNDRNIDGILKRMFALSGDKLISFQYVIATYYSIRDYEKKSVNKIFYDNDRRKAGIKSAFRLSLYIAVAK